MPILNRQRASGSGGQPSGAAADLFTILENLGLDGTCECCLDIGDTDCYPGTGQTVSDLTANNIDFHLGLDGSATSTDPTFVGTADDLLEGTYLSFDGGDVLRCKTNPAFWEAYHKDSADFTILGTVWVPAAGITDHRGWCGSNYLNDYQVGTGLAFQASDDIRFYVTDGNIGAMIDTSSPTDVEFDAWNFIALSVDEASGGTASFWHLNGSTTGTFNGTYDAPGSASTDWTLEVGANGRSDAVGQYIQATMRIGQWAAFSSSLTAAEVISIHDELALRYTFG